MKTGISAWIELDLPALRHNLRVVQRALQPTTTLITVVKADAYGHGLEAVTRCAAAAGVTHFAVAHVAEGLAVRALLPQASILVLCAPPPEAAPELLAQSLTPVIAGPEHGAALEAAVRRCRPRKPLPVHFKIDTGMSRLGFDWTRAPAELMQLAQSNVIACEGICSHFSSADKRDPARSAVLQFKRFASVIAAYRRLGGPRAMRHISASSAFCECPEWDLDGIRLGIILYGYPHTPGIERISVRPVLQWKTRILQIKNLPRGRTVGYGNTHTLRSASRLAVLAVGYADGYSRHLSNRGVVLIDGCRCPVVGRVSMNMLTVSLPSQCRPQAGDVAVLIGRQGQATLWADELAKLCDTIPYEILTSIRH